MSAPEWAMQEIDGPAPLNASQVNRLLRMVEVLRESDFALEQIIAIKNCVSRGEYEEAQALWLDFTHDEQQALNVAPKFGGILKTHEREAVKYGREKA